MQVPVFVQFNGYPPHVDGSYQGRIRLVEQASIEILDLRTTDEGWYECSIVFLHDTATDDDSSNNGTWIYLSVYCELHFHNDNEKALRGDAYIHTYMSLLELKMQASIMTIECSDKIQSLYD